MAPKRLPDPGGIFQSDDHRRVLGHLGARAADGYTSAALLERMAPDRWSGFETTDQLAEVLTELADAGFAREGASGWYRTSAGTSALTGPIADEPDPVEEETP